MNKVFILLIAGWVVLSFAEGGYGGFGITWSRPDVAKLNEKFDGAYGIHFSDNYIGLSGKGWVVIKRITLGCFGFGATQTISNDTMRIEGSYGAGFFEPGLHFKIGHISTDILVGIGGGGYSFSLKKRLGDVSLDSLFANPARTSRVVFGHFALQPALRVTIPIQFIGLVIKGGYIYYPVKPAWELEDGASVLNPPKVSLSGPFFAAHFVFGLVK